MRVCNKWIGPYPLGGYSFSKGYNILYGVFPSIRDTRKEAGIGRDACTGGSVSAYSSGSQTCEDACWDAALANAGET